LSAGGVADISKRRFRRFRHQLEIARDAYVRAEKVKEASLSDKELEKRLSRVRVHALGLRKTLNDQRLQVQAMLLGMRNGNLKKEFHRYPPAGLGTIDFLQYWAETCLKELRLRRKEIPDQFAIPSARQPKLDALVRDLLKAWQIVTGTNELLEKGDSKWVQFLSKGMRVIANLHVDDSAVRKRVNKVIHPLNPTTDRN